AAFVLQIEPRKSDVILAIAARKGKHVEETTSGRCPVHCRSDDARHIVLELCEKPPRRLQFAMLASRHNAPIELVRCRCQTKQKADRQLARRRDRDRSALILVYEAAVDAPPRRNRELRDIS